MCYSYVLAIDTQLNGERPRGEFGLWRKFRLATTEQPRRCALGRRGTCCSNGGMGAAVGDAIAAEESQTTVEAAIVEVVKVHDEVVALADFSCVSVYTNKAAGRYARTFELFQDNFDSNRLGVPATVRKSLTKAERVLH